MKLPASCRRQPENKNKTDGTYRPDDCSNLRPRTTFHPAAIQPCSDFPYKLCNLPCNLCSRNEKRNNQLHHLPPARSNWFPVFSSFRGGLQVLAGPTGGYLIGFIFLALIMGFALDHFDRKLVPTIIGMIIGMAVCYAFERSGLQNF